MGNQLIGIAPSQILPVERYLTEHPDLKFDLGLGSTRFFKVARAESQEGLVVVKIFAIHDPTLPLSTYKDQLDEIRKRLSSAVNCIPFQRIILTEKAGILVREFVKYSLYDRISTRPFLTNIEKRWITFQILYALHQCHKVGVCHGDIKLENITVTSWNWVLLVDFASFKPTFVPEDNPADYSYFFDTSRRRTCYIAPERFSKTTNNENSALITETTCESGELTPAMDIFSTGCALLELWNELHVPFEYSQLLAYRSNKYSPEKHLNNLNNPSLKSLISSMIEIDPSKRLSAEDYLAKERGKLFPEYFFTFLQSYMLIFSATPILSPDEKILRLKSDIANIFKFLGPIKHSHEDDSEKYEKGESEGLVIIISLVTSCIRGLHDCSSKLCSLEILLELSNHANSETILDRILPYIMYLARDNSSRVKIAAINTITKCLELVQQLPKSDSNIFPEYVLPGLAPLAGDPNTCVRAAYAKNIATLAEIALRYLDQMQSDWYDNNIKQKYNHTFNYELELQALHEMVEQTVSVLLTDSQALVKQTLIENGITKLCVFFGKQKANDVLLSHMITFLNDKDDKQLRGSFFDCIVGVAAYIGWHCSGILTPLLLQGLTDPCEFVTTKSINAMSALTELGLLTKSSLCEMVSECSCFLVHPNLWIRQAVVGFITTTTKALSILDVQCKIIPNLSGYMKYPLIQIDKPELLLESLDNPIPRNIYDSVVTYTELDVLVRMLKDRKYAREAANIGRVTTLESWYTPSIKNLFRRLEANGLTEAMEDYFLKMEHHLKKINKHRMATKTNYGDGRIELGSTNGQIKSHVFYLGESQKGDFIADRRLHRTNTSGSIDTNVNSDWNYSSDLVTRHSESTNSGGMSSRSTSSRPSSPPPDPHTPFISTDPSSNISLHERSYIQYRRSSCYLELNKLKIKQQEHYLEALRGKDWAEQTAWLPQLPPPEWHSRGVLVAHLHEHRGTVNRLCTIPDKPLFASCSADGYVRLWDCAKMEGKNIANRSKQHFKTPSGVGVTSMSVCDGGQSLGAATLDGAINILRIDPSGNKMNMFQTRQLNLDEEGFAVDVQCLDSGFQSVLVYATLYGSIIGWDLRTPGIAWKLENSLEKGFITSFCVDSHQSLLTLGTSIGHYKAWDLRFQLPINSFEQPGTEKIKKVISHPTEPSWIISSVHGNNKILMWNLETKSLEKILWGSSAPPLSQSQGPSNSVCALLAGCIDRNPFVLSGGTDQRLRFWNLESPEKSHIVAPAANDHIGSNITYESRLIDGFHVIYENPESDRGKESSEEGPRGGPEQPPAGHRDCITDITLCKASQCFMVSSSRDGIIKVWK
ncbi:Phosphoinositide 3-kinase regulatory subunit 4-like Protein [Tribolium castaneum]|uniref:non-specific serine/threonine protein kinase n=1 Tax=Tribolium castaneum TaxID=7070 RepID=D6X2A3_TRICA|nr:PREDICTED: phosphoinositide 3-kinase regulatory subunit 4 isoform X1 [Tribolium castaneum]EFA10236.2 Phosphoinositide 3-kinase regulatory subunit 4-like Protein [Tribolium castaneum]|eukprot:XP_970683.1 PREDICTED: phosphoinositide 3-kinase regulatory subunit 4 isoform X1 [Tribolium castaneum]